MKKKNVVDNTYKGWKTTIVGLIIIVAAIGSVFYKDVDWASASIALFLGVGLMFTPDTVLTKINFLMKRVTVTEDGTARAVNPPEPPLEASEVEQKPE